MKVSRSLQWFIGIGVLALFIIGALAVNEWISLTETRSVVEQTYSRQLQSVSFSVNDYLFRQAESWMAVAQTESFEHVLQNVPVVAVFTRTKETVTIDSSERSFSAPALYQMLQHLPKVSSGTSFISLDYEEHNRAYVLLIPSDSEGKRGILLDRLNYIQYTVRPQISLITENGIDAALSFPSSAPFWTSSDFLADQAIVSTSLWVVPSLTLSLSITDPTYETFRTKRLWRSGLLVSISTLILVVGLLFTIRSVRREQQLSQLKNDFVANVSHELKTPLSLIRMYTETLEMGRVSEVKKKSYLATIRMESERLTHLISNILNFSKLESGTKKVTLAPLDLNAVLEDVVQRYRLIVEEKGFEFEWIPSKEEVPILGDPNDLAEMLINLIDNALKYSDENKYLSVTVRKDAPSAFLIVQDKGIGISSSDQSLIFDKFYRASSSEIHTTKGAGLGLSIVYELARAHQAEISVQSSLGKGSTFTLSFPLYEYS